MFCMSLAIVVPCCPRSQALLPTPTIREITRLPGLRASGTGINLGSSGEVEIKNDLGVIFVNANPYNATYFEVWGMVVA